MIRYENENNLVHASDYDFNQKVVEAVALARNAENVRSYIDYLGNGKDIQEVRYDKSVNRINQRREGLVIRDREDDER